MTSLLMLNADKVQLSTICEWIKYCFKTYFKWPYISFDKLLFTSAIILYLFLACGFSAQTKHFQSIKNSNGSIFVVLIKCVYT